MIEVSMRPSRPILSPFILLLAMLSLSGCSQKFNDVNDTLHLALLGENDIQKSDLEIQSLPYASMYARLGNGPQAFMVLALAEPTFGINPAQLPSFQLKWLSNDQGMLVTEHGRLIKTLNLPTGNLLTTQSTTTDPLALGLHLAKTHKHWQRQIDWQPGYHFGYQLHSEFSSQGTAVILINETPVETLHFTEHVTVESLALNFDNDFWLHPQTGTVLKSRQKIAPGLPYIEMTLLKPFSLP
ncbi:YjbF family lipoprotein [Photobacterium sp. TY1-4]|uniref:YjbF family lipoprotein n=1 Tax=Photobacterium sp. TY1-4 TaxID=2899122 RepID=UPI0021C0BB7A|nr:YjbF family lipoprotein [Photobacterium sp. TY1-4]UXI00533.1 YjbF family lipoprotein [Photobacterium sp. TY1-4]